MSVPVSLVKDQDIVPEAAVHWSYVIATHPSMEVQHPNFPAKIAIFCPISAAVYDPNLLDDLSPPEIADPVIQSLVPLFPELLNFLPPWLQALQATRGISISSYSQQ